MYMISLRDEGFTIVEVMIALMMAAIIGVAVYNTSKKQQDTYLAQDDVVAMQNNLRAATLMMAREIRMAGYDPTNRANASITAASAASLSFTADLNGDGDTSDSGENITYSLYTADGIQKLGRKNPTQNTPVAEHISNLEFYYLLADGTRTASPASISYSSIRAVQVTILARSPGTDPAISSTTTYKTPSGATWTLAAGYRGRMASFTVKCRNLGL